MNTKRTKGTKMAGIGSKCVDISGHRIGETGHRVRLIALSVMRANQRLRKAVDKHFPVGTAVSIKQLREGRWDYSAGTIAALCEPLSWGAAVQSDDPTMPEFRRMKFGTNVFHFEWSSIELASEVAPDRR